jgi:arylsulfatase A-like enzyme
MAASGSADDSDNGTAARAAAALFTGFAVLAAFDAGAIALTVPRPQGGASLRLAHHVFDAAGTLGVGALAGLLLGAFLRFVRVPRWAAVLAYLAVTTPLSYLAMHDNFHRQAALTFDGRGEGLLFVLLVAGTGALVPVAHLVGAFLSRHPRLRLVGAAVGLGAMIVDLRVLSDDYFGIHAVVAWSAATFAGASLAPLAVRAARGCAARRGGRAALAVVAAFAAFGVLVPPPNAVRVELFRQPCALAPWVLASTLWRAPRLHAPVAAPSSPWFADRAGGPTIAPTRPALLPAGPVVVFLTVDALRADAVLDPANDATLPTLAEIKRRGVLFTHASSPASQTSLSLGTTFSGLYFSELHWTRHGTGARRFGFPSDDPSPRFPGILSEHGVATVDYCSLAFLADDFGVARGFREEKLLAKGGRNVTGKQVVDPLLARLAKAKDEPLFLYGHLMDAHAPYEHGPRGATERERYLAGAGIADAQIGRVLRALEQRFAGRFVLFVAADHGEAFGDHETYQHSKTLYEELLHVPLLAIGPTVAPRTIAQRVGLVDLGPTILDLFGVETPATFEGQSLVPLLAGGDVVLGRPLLAEGRLRRAITMPDGLKVIDDPRRQVVEVYDLAADPGETRNLFDVDPARADPALAALRAFFEVHTLKRDGYRPPFEP